MDWHVAHAKIRTTLYIRWYNCAAGIYVQLFLSKSSSSTDITRLAYLVEAGAIGHYGNQMRLLLNRFLSKNNLNQSMRVWGLCEPGCHVLHVIPTVSYLSCSTATTPISLWQSRTVPYPACSKLFLLSPGQRDTNQKKAQTYKIVQYY